jgi:dipeptidyl-peptidase-3
LAHLKHPSKEIFTYKELAVHYQTDLVEHFNALTPEERVFAYYMYRAGIAGNTTAIHQIHRHGQRILDIFTALYTGRKDLKNITNPFDGSTFIKEVEIFLVYVYANHGQYFEREHFKNKRTPSSLGLNTLTHDNILYALKKTDYTHTHNPEKELDIVKKSLFDTEYEQTLTVPGSIADSAINFYADDFTNEDYYTLDPDIRSHIHAYFYIEHENGSRIAKAHVYSAQDIDDRKLYSSSYEKYEKALATASFWLCKARDHAHKHPQHFDNHTYKSLDYLVSFLQTGDESYFKKHSIEWLQCDNKIDYSFGFIETYKDPKSHRGSFQAEVTIKTIDINELNEMLPAMEKELPFDKAFKKNVIDKLPNASINTQVCGHGDLGPQKIVAAYCLPNYEDIRSDYGSKQIIYQATEGLSFKLKPEIANNLMFLSEQAQWLDEHDKDHAFMADLWNIQCILHETIGHGSGKLGQHTFKKDEKLTIENKTYKPGDTIDVTSENLKELLDGYEQTLEELRAEIIALYISITHLDELRNNVFVRPWAQKMNDKELISWMIIHMARTGLNRLIQQPDNTDKVHGDHARANYTILNYLLDHDALNLTVEDKNINGQEYHVPGLTIKDLNKAQSVIKELMIKVQTIKSTGDGHSASELINTYGIHIKDYDILKYMKKNHKALVGPIKSTIYMYPLLKPMHDLNDTIIDINAVWPDHIYDQYKHEKALQYSCS